MRTSIHWVELAAGRLAIMARPRAADWLEDELANVRSAGGDVLVSLLTAQEEDELGLSEEGATARRLGLEFRSFPILDRHVPADGEAARAFVQALFEAVNSGRGVVIHCRMGIGRSSLIAASVMVLAGVEPNEALVRLSKARGTLVPDTEAQRQWIIQFVSQALQAQHDTLAVKAMENAKKRAEQMAAAVGSKVGRVLRAVPSNSGMNSMQTYSAGGGVSIGGAATGAQRASISIDVDFELDPAK